MIWSKTQIFVAPRFDIPAQTCTFTACFAIGLCGCSLPTFTHIDLVCFTSYTELSSVHMMSSKESLAVRQRWAISILLALFLSEIMGPAFILTRNQCSFCHRNRGIVCVGICLLNFFAIKRCNSIALISPSSSSILSKFSVMLSVITEGCPDLCWSYSPTPLVQERIRCVTVHLLVQISSFAKSFMICATVSFYYINAVKGNCTQLHTLISYVLLVLVISAVQCFQIPPSTEDFSQ